MRLVAACIHILTENRASPRQAAPPDDAHGICAMPILRPRFREVFAALLRMAERSVRSGVTGARLESPAALVCVPRSCLVEGLTNVVQIGLMRDGKGIYVVEFH